MNKLLLERLSDGQFHSGSRLGDELGTGRAAVWKGIRQLRQLGLPVSAITGKGYCVSGGLELLDQGRITAAVNRSGQGALLSQLTVHTVLDSTSRWLWQRCDEGIPSGSVCMAESQTAGRGRLGRHWFSPLASGILLSLMWRYRGTGSSSLEGLSLAVGVMIIDCLADFGISGFDLKWPNDVLHSGRKIAGILVDLRGDLQDRCDIVVGIGMNVRMPHPDNVPVDQPWADLSTVSPQPVSRNELAAALLARLLPVLDIYPQRGFADWQSRWQNLDALYGNRVVITSGGRRAFGIADGIDERGSLWLRTRDGRQQYSGGEVTVRGE